MKRLGGVLMLLGVVSMSSAALAMPLEGEEAEAQFQAGRLIAQGAELKVEPESVTVDAYNKLVAPRGFSFDGMIIKRINEKGKEATVDLYEGDTKLQSVKMPLQEVGWDTKEDSKITGYHLTFGKEYLDLILGSPVMVRWAMSIEIYKDTLRGVRVAYAQKNQNPWMAQMDFRIAGYCTVEKKDDGME